MDLSCHPVPILIRFTCVDIPQTYKVSLDTFEGPLDLLLHLVQKDEVDIYSLNLVRLINQYLVYIRSLQAININLSGEFITMTAQLIYLKSKTLLPRSLASSNDEDEVELERWDLIKQLIEYKKYKEVSLALADKQQSCAQLYPRQVEVPPRTSQLQQYSVFALHDCLQRLLQRRDTQSQQFTVQDEHFLISDASQWITSQFNSLQEQRTFDELFPPNAPLDQLITHFLAILELLKNRTLSLHQSEHEFLFTYDRHAK